MVRMDQVQRGIARYLDEEFTAKLGGWQKWVFGAASAMFLENFSTTAQRVRDNEMVKTFGVFDEAGNVDVEKLYRYFKAQAEKSPVTFTIPLIGPVTMNAQDVDRLYACITQS